MDATFEAVEARLAALERSRSRMRRVVIVLGMIVAMLGAPVVGHASHLFSDVATSNTFHADVHALAYAGITAGCAVGKYCPNDPVTRGQMAAFLHRAGGTIAAELGTAAETSFFSVATGNTTTEFVLVREVQVPITGVANGGLAHQFVHVQGRVILGGFLDTVSGCPCQFGAMIFNTEGAYTSTSQSETFDLGDRVARVALDVDAVIPITPGLRTFRLYVKLEDRKSTANPADWSITGASSLIATTYPFGTVVLP